MTSSTPEALEVVVGGRVVRPGAREVVQGSRGVSARIVAAPFATVSLALGDRTVDVRCDETGHGRYDDSELLRLVAGELVVAAGEHCVVLLVRPDALTDELLHRLLDDLDRVARGLGAAAGGLTSRAGVASRDADLRLLEASVGLAADAAPAIRRRPIHRARETVRATPREHGPRNASDVRWLATHPVAHQRAAAGGRMVGVVRERRFDLDTLENRGVLAAHDLLSDAADGLRAAATAEVADLRAARSSREAFVTARGSLWSERDAPRLRALERRLQHLDDLRGELTSLRARAGLPDLRPRARAMVRTAKVDAEPAYWATYRAAEAVRRVEPAAAPPPAPLRSLDVLWEHWCVVMIVQTLSDLLGPPDAIELAASGWFADLRPGTLATWHDSNRTVTASYEPEIGACGPIRKVVPGKPWRPDVVVEVRWADGTLDLHVLDAKLIREGGGPPWSALREVWHKYGDTIGDERGFPLVRSVWAVWPGERLSPMVPRMLDPEWPLDRLRGGCVGVLPGGIGALERVLGVLLTPPFKGDPRGTRR